MSSHRVTFPRSTGYRKASTSRFSWACGPTTVSRVSPARRRFAFRDCPTKFANTERGASSPENPAFSVPLPPSSTITSGSSSSSCADIGAVGAPTGGARRSTAIFRVDPLSPRRSPSVTPVCAHGQRGGEAPAPTRPPPRTGAAPPSPPSPPSQTPPAARWPSPGPAPWHPGPWHQGARLPGSATAWAASAPQPPPARAQTAVPASPPRASCALPPPPRAVRVPSPSTPSRG